MKAAVLGAKDEQGKVVQNIPDTRGHDDDRDRFTNVFFRFEYGFDDDVLQVIAEQVHHRGHNDQSEIRMDAGQRHGPVGHVHANHEQRAMSKIDDLEHAEDNGKPHGGQTVNRPDEDAIDCVFKNIEHKRLRTGAD